LRQSRTFHTLANGPKSGVQLTCQYSFETLTNTRAEAEERAKKAFCEDHHLMNWTIHADRCQVQPADLPS
jgi:hypothetical protein